MLMESDLQKLKNCRLFSMVQLLVVITLVINGMENRDIFVRHFNIKPILLKSTYVCTSSENSTTVFTRRICMEDKNKGCAQ